jgi:hypothetical protein
MRALGLILILFFPGMVFAHIDPRSDCVMHLGQISFAKGHLQIEKNLPDGAPCRAEDLLAYLPNKSMPRCRLGGSYTIGPLGTEPTCSIPSHSQAALDEELRKRNASSPVSFWLCIAAVGFLIAVGGYMALGRSPGK